MPARRRCRGPGRYRWRPALPPADSDFAWSARRRNRRRAAASQSPSAGRLPSLVSSGHSRHGLLLAHTVDGAFRKRRLHVVVRRDEVRGNLRRLRAIGRVAGRAQAHRLKYFLDLAVGKLRGILDFLAEGLGAVAAARQRTAPAQQRVRAAAPVIDPAVVDGDVSVRKVAGVDGVLALYLAGGVDHLAAGDVELVVGERAGERIHT